VFYIHPGFFSQLSHPLNDIIRNSIADSSENCIVWEEVDSTVFLLFAEFAYTGQYHCPVPTKADKDDASLGLSKRYASDAFALPYSQNWYGACGSCPHRVANDGKKHLFVSVTCDCGPSKTTKHFISAFLLQYCGHAGTRTCFAQSFTDKSVERLIAHVQMWIIAAEYDVTKLMDKAARNLASKLAQWQISSSTFIPQFGKFIRYIYANTAGCCQLRQVVASFAACVDEDVCALEGWEALLADMPNFTMDLVRHMTNRRVGKW